MTSTWASLPDQTRDRIDQLVLQDRRIQAIRELWQCGIEPRPSLGACHAIIAERYDELADSLQWKPEEPRDSTTLISHVQALPGRPAAIEAFWDGDTQGWFVILAAVMAEPDSDANLALIRHGGDMRLLNGQVPPWPEAQEAESTGRTLAQHFGVPFHFASPDTPDDEAPRWRESN